MSMFRGLEQASGGHCNLGLLSRHLGEVIQDYLGPRPKYAMIDHSRIPAYDSQVQVFTLGLIQGNILPP